MRLPCMHPGLRPGPSRRIRARLCAGLLLLGAWLPILADPSPAPAAPFPLEIEKARAALRDLRVYLDFDEDTATFAVWPTDKNLRKLPADQIARAVRLGLSLWASVLPDMRFRFVNLPAEANLGIRFGPYAHSGIRRDGARSFLPAQWAPSLDAECGLRKENRRPDGSPCREWEGNLIIVYPAAWAGKEADLVGDDLAYRHFAWIFDPARPHYLMEGKGPCRDGNAPGTVWSDTCVPFGESPVYDSLAGCDLAAIIQHEFGHALLGDHADSPYECVDYARRPILSRDSCVRIGKDGFSVMFPGDGVDAWWNRRGIFEAEARRLKRKGYRVAYPEAHADLVLARRDGATLRTRDWRKAVRAMIWPFQPAILSPVQARRQYFLVDVDPDRD